MAVIDVIGAGIASLWAAFVVYRLETLGKHHRDLWERVTRIESAVCPDDE